MQQIYELNLRAWCAERSVEIGRTATLDDLPHEFFDRLVEHGFTWLYLLGLWPTGPLSRAVSLRDHQLRSYLGSILPEVRDEDIPGSPFAIFGYQVDASMGGEDALARLRRRAQSSGLSLMLDFIPNHIGLDHAWVEEHPEYCIQGDERALREFPESYCRISGRIFAHGRDPFFPPWRSTIQLDYANEHLQKAMMTVACHIAARCDGVRCDVAMLLLSDVFANTWKRPMAHFWKPCLDRVRAEHPGTLFMAEVYWNREYELQQAGFDFTYDKILYDRLIDGHAESIRAHLRASPAYQSHCVRFLENHEEQRAASVFPDPEHHRAALLLTGMVPGMLLCHHGQEDGRRFHAPLHAGRRPVEPGSGDHRDAFSALMHLLSEPARHEGSWRMLEPRAPGSNLIGCLWSLPLHHSLLLIVNAGRTAVSSALEAGPCAGRDCLVQDFFASNAPVMVSGEVLSSQGFVVDLPPWGVRVLRIMPQR